MARPSTAVPPTPAPTVGRGLVAFVTLLVAGFLALLVLPAVLGIVVWLGGPALAGVVFAGPGADRNVVQIMGIWAALGWAVAAGAWTAIFLDAHPAAVAVSVFVTALIGAVIAVFIVYLVSLRFRKPGGGLDED